MNQRDKHLKTIRENPDDDSTWLAFASWLDKCGDPLGEYIRLDREMKRLPGHDASLRKVSQLADRLMRTNQAQWVPYRAKLGGRAIPWSDSGPFDSVRLEQAEDRDLSCFSGCTEIRSLNLESKSLGSIGFQHLQAIPNLEVLKLFCLQEIDENGLRALSRLPKLRSLLLSGLTFPPDWVRIFDSAPFLLHLTVGDNDEQLNEAIEQWKSRRMKRFRKRTLMEQRQEAIEALGDISVAWSSWRPYGRNRNQLKVLDLNQAGITSDLDVEYCSVLHELETIDLGETKTTTKGLKHLSKLPNLRSLELFECSIDSIKPLASCSGLKHLFLFGTKLKEDGLKDIGRLKNLEELYVQHVSDVTLSRLKALKKLRLLHFGYYNRHITDAGIASLRVLEELQVLILHGAKISDVGLQQLEALKNLKWLDVRDTSVSPETCQSLVDRIPGLVVFRSHETSRKVGNLVSIKHVDEIVRSYEPTRWSQWKAPDDVIELEVPAEWERTIREIQKPAWEELFTLKEDGFADGWGSEGPARAHLTTGNVQSKLTPSQLLSQLARLDDGKQLKPVQLELDLPPRVRFASARYLVGNEQHISFLWIRGRQAYRLDCLVPKSRFKLWEPTFLRVARSFRLRSG